MRYRFVLCLMLMLMTQVAYAAYNLNVYTMSVGAFDVFITWFFSSAMSALAFMQRWYKFSAEGESFHKPFVYFGISIIASNIGGFVAMALSMERGFSGGTVLAVVIVVSYAPLWFIDKVKEKVFGGFFSQ